MEITVETRIKAPMETVWQAWTTPADIMLWNAASDDWHTTKASVDLRVGGRFCSRMEAKDGSFGFDFEGHYTKIIPHQLLEAEFGGRRMTVAFALVGDVVELRETFDAEDSHPLEMQRQGWQAILDRFKAHAEHLARQG